MTPTRDWTIRAMNPANGTEEQYTYHAASLIEALLMAERADAGHVNRIYGVRPEDYDCARHEGILFNEADGLLVEAVVAVREIERLYAVADDDEAATLEALQLRAGLLWRCEGPHTDTQPAAWVVRDGSACALCGRTTSDRRPA